MIIITFLPIERQHGKFTKFFPTKKARPQARFFYRGIGKATKNIAVPDLVMVCYLTTFVAVLPSTRM